MQNVVLFFLLVIWLTGGVALAQFPKRQLAVYVTPKPHKQVFKAEEPILIDIEIKNELKHEIRLTAWAFSPNEWNGETGHIEFYDIYRLPRIFQIRQARPSMKTPEWVAAPGWYPIPAKASKTSTIDASKWEVTGGWVPGKYQLVVRVIKIDLDEHSWVSVLSDPFTIEIQ